MENQASESNTAAEILERPEKELAQHIMRKLSWEERIEGEIYVPGPGSAVYRLYKLEEIANILTGLTSFEINFGRLQKWIGTSLKDQELADAVERVLSDDSASQRESIAKLISARVAQCKEVLEEA